VSQQSPLYYVNLLSPGSTTIGARAFGKHYEWDPNMGMCVATTLVEVREDTPIQVTVTAPPPTTVSLGCDRSTLVTGTTSPTRWGTCTANGSPPGGTYFWEVNTPTLSLGPAPGIKCDAQCDYTADGASASVGDTIITVTYVRGGQTARASSQPITVLRPEALLIRSDGTDPVGTACASVPCLDDPGGGTCNAVPGSSCSYNSYLRTRVYSVLDQFGREFVNVGITEAAVREEYSAITGTCTNVTLQTGTDMMSVFADRFSLCHTCCLPGGPGCNASSTQRISVNTHIVRVVNVDWGCTGVTLSP